MTSSKPLSLIAPPVHDQLPDKIVVQSLSKKYGKRAVLHDVNLHINSGEVVALLGPNGSGKTTCFYIIAGLAKPNSGSIILNQHDITSLPVYQRARLGIGYLPQENSIFRDMNVENNIKSILQTVSRDKAWQEKRLEDLLYKFSITDIRRSYGVSLSGGERRRVEIARCLASAPKFVLLDEPFAGVDPISVNEIRALVRNLKNDGIGILITDHNVRETLEIVDRAYILYNGKMLMNGTKADVLSHKVVRDVYLGDSF